MQSQMNPHFLYNTLETVNWKIMEQTGKRTAANDMLEDLSEILVYSLDEREQATMEQEIHVTECGMANYFWWNGAMKRRCLQFPS